MEHLESQQRAIVRWGSSDEAASSKTPFGAGDVLYGKLRPYLRKVALADSDGVCSTEIIVLRPRDTAMIPEFLYYLCASPSLLRYSIDHSAGTRMPRISPSLLLKASIPVPPIQEQRRIADLLSAVDTALESQVQRVAAARVLSARVIDSLMNDPLWPIRRLDEVADVGGGITVGGRSSGDTRTVPYLRVANVQHGRLDLGEVKEVEATSAEIARHALRPDDVLLLEGGNKEDVGRGWIWSGEIDLCLHQNHLHRARPRTNIVEPRFLAYSICRTEARAYCLLHGKQTSNLATINRTQISALPLRVPEIAEQRRTVEVLDALRADWEASDADATVLRELRQSLISALVAGVHVMPESYDRFFAETAA